MIYSNGEVAEWLKAHAWKACKREIVSGVRIPSSPPELERIFYIFIKDFIVDESLHNQKYKYTDKNHLS